MRNFQILALSLFLFGVGYNAVFAADLATLSQEYAPVIRFHPEEVYFPASVEWYVNQSSLFFRGQEVVKAGQLTPFLLGSWKPDSGELLTNDQAAESLTLKIPSDREAFIRAGNLDSARCYVHPHLTQDKRFLDIHYALVFPFNGSVQTRLGSCINKLLCRLGVGTHEGDIEHVTVRLSNTGNELLGVYFSAHSDESQWVKYDPPRTSEGRLLAYSAKFTHAMYPKAGSITRKVRPSTSCVKCGMKKVWTPLVDKTSDQGPYIDCRERAQIIDENTPIEEASWLGYRGRWGGVPSEKYGSNGPVSLPVRDWWILGESEFDEE